MENASKAITWAGGILIAVLLISLAMYFLNTYRDFYATIDKSKQTKAVVDFNRFFTESMYNDGVIYGYDALNIINKANEINDDAYAPTYITINATSITYSDTNYSELKKEYKYSYELDSKTGYISSITIE